MSVRKAENGLVVVGSWEGREVSGVGVGVVGEEDEGAWYGGRS